MHACTCERLLQWDGTWWVRGTCNADMSWKKVQVERGALNFSILCKRQMIIQTLRSDFEICLLPGSRCCSQMELVPVLRKCSSFIRLSNVYPIIWLYHFWLYDEKLIVFKIECFNSSSIWSLRLLWQPPWKLWKALILSFQTSQIFQLTHRFLAVALTERLTLNNLN